MMVAAILFTSSFLFIKPIFCFHHPFSASRLNSFGKERYFQSNKSNSNIFAKNEMIDIDYLSESPESLCKATDLRPRLSKNEAYATAIQESWNEEVKEMQKDASTTVTHSQNLYTCEEKDGTITTLYGHIYVSGHQNEKSTKKNPGVVFFHTGAGPHDIFLHWKAHYLATEMGYTVLIADMISDDVGWAWSDDRSKYESARKHILEVQNGKRTHLRRRITASLLTLKNLPSVDSNNIGAIGWCFGGQVAMEIVNMKNNVQGLKSLATFHGVFDGVESFQISDEPEKDENGNVNCNLPSTLICNGDKDPFVPNDDKLMFKKLLQYHDWEWVDYKNCLHGFSNPAQGTNHNPNFDYNESAAKESWTSVCNFLIETIGSH